MSRCLVLFFLPRDFAPRLPRKALVGESRRRPLRESTLHVRTRGISHNRITTGAGWVHTRPGFEGMVFGTWPYATDASCRWFSPALLS